MRASQERQLSSTIEALYLAVSDDEQWPIALAGLGRAFDSPRVGILRCSPSFEGVYETRALNHAPEAQRLYRDYYWRVDPTYLVPRDAPVGKWLYEPDLLDPRTTPQPEYVNDFALKHGIRWVGGGKVGADRSVVTLLSLQRPPDHRPFDGDAAPVFARLAVHVERAATLASELRSAQLARGLAVAALDALDYPVYAVNAAGRILLANHSGELHLVEGRPFRVRAGTLAALDVEGGRRLAQAVRLAGERQGSAFALQCGGEAWLVRVLPIAGFANGALVYAAPAASAPLPAEVLRQLLGFSSAEASIAFLLADGRTAKEIAFARQVSVNTVRAQIREIFRKAGVRRQADLARLLMALPRVQAPGPH